jgi:antitoxin (DNA-binding transcriptional repressor) of toxin-antitoxin stability system
MDKTPTTHTITTKELRKFLPRVIEAVAAGHSFTVVKRAQVVFQITPTADEGNWQTIADFTQIDKEGVPADDIL